MVAWLDIQEGTESQEEYELCKPKLFISKYEAKKYVIEKINKKIEEEYGELVQITDDEKHIEDSFLEIMEIGKRLLKTSDETYNFNFQIAEEEIELSQFLKN